MKTCNCTETTMSVVEDILYLFIVMIWFFGIATVKGFWSTFFALVPPVGIIDAFMWFIDHQEKLSNLKSCLH